MEPISHMLFKDRDKSLQDRLKRLCKGGFAAMDMAEPLLCYDADKSAREVRSILEQRRLAVAGEVTRRLDRTLARF